MLEGTCEGLLKFALTTQKYLGLEDALRCRVKWVHVVSMGSLTKAFLSLGMFGMVVLDVSIPEEPKVLAEMLDGHGGMTLKHFSIEKCILYTACGRSGLRIFTNIDDNIDEIGALVHSRCNAKSVAIQGDIALVTFGCAGVRVLDVANPRNPVELGGYKDDVHEARFILLRDGWAFVSFGHAGIRILDVTNASMPTEISSYLHGNYDARHMALSGPFLFIAFSFGGIKVLDLSNPFSPVEVGSISFPPYAANCIQVIDGIVYVALGVGGLRLLQFSPHLAFHQLGSYVRSDADVTSVHVTIDRLAYLCLRQGMLRILDVRHPESIREVSEYTPDARRLLCTRCNLM